MSTPGLLPAQAHAARRRNTLRIVGLVMAFPFDSQRFRRRRGPMAVRRQPPEQALLLAHILRLAASQAPLQRAQGPLLLAGALHRLRRCFARLCRLDALRLELHYAV